MTSSTIPITDFGPRPFSVNAKITPASRNAERKVQGTRRKVKVIESIRRDHAQGFHFLFNLAAALKNIHLVFDLYIFARDRKICSIMRNISGKNKTNTFQKAETRLTIRIIAYIKIHIII